MTENTPPFFETIRYECRDGAAWLTLNRPQVLNVFDPRMVEELDRAMTLAEPDPRVHALVLTGAGRAFCAGGDLSFVDGAMNRGARDPRTVFLERLLVVLRRLEEFPKPVIAAVNGIAVGGGLEIVACCDLVIAAESAKLGDVHANYGLIPGGGNSVRLPRRIGLNHAKWLLYTGETWTAAQMERVGLINRVVPDAELANAVHAVVATLAKKSPLAMRRVKALVHGGLEHSIDAALRAELVAGEAHAQSHDMREGVSAFVEKRTPRFNGT